MVKVILASLILLNCRKKFKMMFLNFRGNNEEEERKRPEMRLTNADWNEM